jgi:hypothetical protein
LGTMNLARRGAEHIQFVVVAGHRRALAWPIFVLWALRCQLLKSLGNSEERIGHRLWACRQRHGTQFGGAVLNGGGQRSGGL